MIPPAVRPSAALASALCALALAASAHAAAIKWTGGGGNNFWETAGNWDLGRRPAVGDDVTLPGGKGDITTDGTSLNGNNFVITAASLTIEASPADAGATRIVGNDAGRGVSISVAGDLTIGSKSGVAGTDGSAQAGKTEWGGSVQLISAGGNIRNSGAVTAGNSAGLNPPPLHGGRIAITAMTILNDGLLESGNAGNNEFATTQLDGGNGGSITLTAKKEASPAITNAGIIRTGNGGTGGGEIQNPDVQYHPGWGGVLTFRATAKSTVLHTGTITTGDGGNNASTVAGQKGGDGGWLVCSDALLLTPVLPLPLAAPPVIALGLPGAGTVLHPHPYGARGVMKLRKVKMVKPAGGVPAGVAAASDSFYTSSYTLVQDALVTVDPEGTEGSVDLSNLNTLAIAADSSVIFDLCSTCTVDLRGNDGSATIIRAGQSICIYGNVLMDPGVTIDQLTNPPATVSPSAPCALPPNTAVGPRALRVVGHGLRVAMLSASPGHAGGIRFGYSLPPQGGNVTLEIYDVLGRRVAGRREGWMSGGEHQASWQPRLPGAGTYLLEVRAVGQRGSTRFTRLD